MFGFAARKKGSTRWQDVPPADLQEAARPLLELALTAIKAHGELVVSPGSEKATKYLERLLEVSERLSSTCNPSRIQAMTEKFAQEAADFGSWQRLEVANLISEMHDAVKHLIRDAQESLSGREEVVENVSAMTKRLESAGQTTDIARLRAALRTEIAAARQLVQQQTASLKKQRSEMDRVVDTLSRRLNAVEAERNTDPVTGVASRAAFEFRGASVAQKVAYGEGPFTLAIVDMDGLKKLNDTLGHQAGDAALQYFASELTRAVGKDAFVARLAGDEFAVILPGVPTALAGSLTRLCEKLARGPVTVKGPKQSWQIKTGCSAGVTPFKSGASLADVMAVADSALYEAKKQGGNMVQTSFAAAKAA
ncbi:MAG: GGDEF domain-containing protein [Armatimonadota bacterium]